MTHQEIKALAGHRAIPPWIMKLVSDAIAIEREACAKVCDSQPYRAAGAQKAAQEIRARGEPTSRGDNQ